MRTIKFATLVFCSFLLAACGGGGSGGGSGSGNTPPPPVTNSPPTVTVNAIGVDAMPGATDLATSLGANVSLDAAASTDPDADLLSYEWTMPVKPATSTLAFATTHTAAVAFTPDALGTYELLLKVTDTRSASAEKRIKIVANNSPPTPSVAITATLAAAPTTAPTQIVSIGAAIVIDATGTTDPDGNAVTKTFTMVESPSGSSPVLTVDPQTARFTADQQGIYRVRLRGQDSIGAYFETVYVFDAQNHPPQAVVLTSVTSQQSNSGQNTVTSTVGYNVQLTGNVTDAENDAVTRAWSLTSRPTGSAATLGSASAASTQFTPDVLGNYVVVLVATDTRGASTRYTTTIQANNTRPVASIGTNATPVALPAGPSIRVPVNTLLTLRGTGSTDADGDTLTFLWTVVSRPATSTAALSTPNAATTTFTPDVSGTYSLRLRATDPAGAYSERLLSIAIGNYPPVAVIDKNRTTVLAGRTLTASGALSFDEDGSPLTYLWTVDARPASSTATIAAPTSSTLSFTPDRSGMYVIALTVNDGTASNVAYVTVRAMASISGSVALPFVPLEAKYSKGLDKVVIAAANPNALYIVDPFTGSIRSVALPASIRSYNVSPNGTLAVVLHESLVSLVDLQTGTLVRSSLTQGLQTDAFVQDDGFAYLIGQSGGQWVDHPVTLINLRTGDVTFPVVAYGGGAYFYGTQKGVFANLKNRVLFMAYGLSPADISYFDVNQATHEVPRSGDSPYHGTYSLGQDFYLSGNQDLIFTSYGTFFYTETLTFAGTLRMDVPGFISMSHSSTADEALVLQSGYSGNYPYTNVYLPTYKRYHSALFLEDADLPLPLVGGQQSYGLRIFHSAADNHVALVQTGDDDALVPGLSYWLIYR